MKAGLIGYYGFGNYGDEIFCELWKRRFPENRILGRDYAGKYDDLDLVIIGGGDLIYGNGWSAGYFRDSIPKDMPVYVVGVGVSTTHPMIAEKVTELSRWFDEHNVKCIITRDQESANWLNKSVAIPNTSGVEVGVDLAWAWDFDRFKHIKRHGSGIIVRREMKDIPRMYNERYIFASMGQELQWDVETLNPDNMEFWPYSIDEITMQIAGCEVIYSSKLHGCIAAIAMGIPVIKLLNTSKFENLFNSFGCTSNLITGRSHEAYLLGQQAKEIIRTITQYTT